MCLMHIHVVITSQRLFSRCFEAHVTCTQDKGKPVLFSMARLDHVKNLTGLAEWFARNKRLRQLCNLVIVGGIVDPSQTTGGIPSYALTRHCFMRI